MKSNHHLAAFFIALFVIMMSCSLGGPAEVTTQNGYRMSQIRDVEGESPKQGDWVLFNVKVYANDSLLDDTYKNEYPQVFQIKTLDEMKKLNHPVIDAFQTLSKDDSVHVYYPADSMKGDKFGLKSGESLEYFMTIEDVLDQEGYEAWATERKVAMNAKRAEVQQREPEIAELVKKTLSDYKTGTITNLQKDDSGLEYVILKSTDGEELEVGQTVNVHYYGVLKSDGSEFDNSFKRGDVLSFPLGQGRVIRGWEIGVDKLKKGEQAMLFIPSDLAYGAEDKPGIPGGSDLVFYVEVME